MNNIIYFDISSFIILAIFVVALLARRQVRDRANTILLILIELATLATLGDFMAAYIENGNEASETARIMANAFNYLFFVAQNLIFPVYTLYVYATIDIWHIYKSDKKLRILWWSVLGVAGLILATNPFTHLVFEIVEPVVYVRRPLVAVYYITSVFYAAWAMGVIIKYRDIVRKDKIQTLFVLYPMVISTVIIQLFKPELLVEMLGVSMAVLFFMIVLQRHEYQIDPITGAMKYATSMERIATIFKMHKPITIILIKIVNNNN